MLFFVSALTGVCFMLRSDPAGATELLAVSHIMTDYEQFLVAHGLFRACWDQFSPAPPKVAQGAWAR